jgi:putative endonuclease
MLDHFYYAYLLANKRNGTLCTGVTNNLERRVYLHKSKTLKGFTQDHNVNKLVYFEETNCILRAPLLIHGRTS